MFKKYTAVAEFGTYEEIFANYLNTNGTEGIDVSGRITVKETVAPEPAPVEPTPVEPAPVPTPEAAPTEVTYIVISGDVLWKIAAQYNLTYEELAEYNNLANPHLIYPAQVLKVPTK